MPPGAVRTGIHSSPRARIEDVKPFSAIAATASEVSAPRAGDDLVPDADVVMDRAFTVEAPPERVWPWLVQLGKWRAGWYLPGSVERLLPRSRRASRSIRSVWQDLAVGDVVPDYGGAGATFEVALLDPPVVLVYRSRRRGTTVSWSITLTPVPRPGTPASPGTRVHLRLRLGPVRHPRVAASAGGFVDALTIAGLAAGLRERVGPTQVRRDGRARPPRRRR